VLSRIRKNPKSQAVLFHSHENTFLGLESLRCEDLNLSENGNNAAVGNRCEFNGESVPESGTFYRRDTRLTISLTQFAFRKKRLVNAWTEIVWAGKIKAYRQRCALLFEGFKCQPPDYARGLLMPWRFEPVLPQ